MQEVFNLEKSKQSIVPVKLQDNQTNLRSVGKPQRLVARLKNKQAQLFIYMGIDASTLNILLTEMSFNEAR